MVTKLIKLQDGTLVEVEVTPEQVQQISGGDVFAKKVKTNLTQIQPLIIKTCQSLAAAWKDVHQELSKDLDIEQAEVELALSFDASISRTSDQYSTLFCCTLSLSFSAACSVFF